MYVCIYPTWSVRFGIMIFQASLLATFCLRSPYSLSVWPLSIISLWRWQDVSPLVFAKHQNLFGPLNGQLSEERDNWHFYCCENLSLSSRVMHPVTCDCRNYGLECWCGGHVQGGGSALKERSQFTIQSISHLRSTDLKVFNYKLIQRRRVFKFLSPKGK